MDGYDIRDALEWWLERAAIREFDGEMKQGRAEHKAASEDVRKRYGTVPIDVQEAVRECRDIGQKHLFD